jgi:hypothetical protein
MTKTVRVRMLGKDLSVGERNSEEKPSDNSTVNCKRPRKRNERASNTNCLLPSSLLLLRVVDMKSGKTATNSSTKYHQEQWKRSRASQIAYPPGFSTNCPPSIRACRLSRAQTSIPESNQSPPVVAREIPAKAPLWLSSKTASDRNTNDKRWRKRSRVSHSNTQGGARSIEQLDATAMRKVKDIDYAATAIQNCQYGHAIAATRDHT